MQGLTKIFHTVLDIAKKLKISDIKTSKKPKNIKELEDSLPRNYWNKTEYIWLHNKEK